MKLIVLVGMLCSISGDFFVYQFIIITKQNFTIYYKISPKLNLQLPNSNKKYK